MSSTNDEFGGFSLSLKEKTIYEKLLQPDVWVEILHLLIRLRRGLRMWPLYTQLLGNIVIPSQSALKIMKQSSMFVNTLDIAQQS